MGYFQVPCRVKKLLWRFLHVVKQLLFSMFSSIVTFEFHLILRSFFTFSGVGLGFKTVFWSIHVVEQLLFSIVPSIQTFVFNLILESFLTFWGPNGLFLDQGRV